MFIKSDKTMKPDALKHAMYYGLILGLIFCLNFFLSTLKGTAFSILQSLVTCAIPFVCYWLTIDCRRRVCNDTMSYGMALWYGIQLFFYASIIAAAFKFAYFKFINPEFLPNLINESLKLMEEMHLPGVSTSANQIEEVLTPLNFALQYIWIDVFIGIFVSFVTAAFAKKDKSLFGEKPTINDSENPTQEPE